jgi:SAM-dependent methyltransferase
MTKDAAPPQNWSDADTWDRLLREQVPNVPMRSASLRGLRSAKFIVRHGGRVWFPGCGVDPSPTLYAALGCRVAVTDISPFAINWQRQFFANTPSAVVTDWESFLQRSSLSALPGSFEAAIQDFSREHPDGLFDVVVNRRAFSQLNREAQRRTALNFERALRPGGYAIIDTLNVQGTHRNDVEDSLLEAGFFIPNHTAERWYRDRLISTGITFVMVLGSPLIPMRGQYPPKDEVVRKEHDRAILKSFRAEYEARLAEAASEHPRLEDGVTKVAHIVYSTG